MSELLPTLEQLIKQLEIGLVSKATQVVLYDRSMNEVVKYDSLSEIEDKYKSELAKTVDWDGESPIIHIHMINYKGETK